MSIAVLSSSHPTGPLVHPCSSSFWGVGAPPSNPSGCSHAWAAILSAPKFRQPHCPCPAVSLLFPWGFSEPPVCSSQLLGEVPSPLSTSRGHHIFCWPPPIAFLSSDLLQCQFLIHLKFCSPCKVEISPFGLLVLDSPKYMVLHAHSPVQAQATTRAWLRFKEKWKKYK